ncbi:MAG: T9SS type A sorting domain-containing protein [Sphingobacteriales bacterium]|nr:MAG: T9SS type A sorting domain-containing protein [Sphingobacteriales bacterium]
MRRWIMNQANTSAVQPIGNQRFSVYPNPASGVIYMSGAEGFSWKLFDTLGRLIGQTEGSFMVLEHLSPGVYLLIGKGKVGEQWQTRIVKY